MKHRNLFLLPLLLGSAPALAQTVETDDETADAADHADTVSSNSGVIVVTAQKRAENVQDLPASVIAAAGTKLDALGITDPTALESIVPGLVISDVSGNGMTFLRGVGQTTPSSNAQPGVSLNQNGVNLPQEFGTTPLYDIERVEVLPGPQGTLWGANAAGGAINFITKRPEPFFEASAELDYGNYNALRAVATINVPLGSDSALRVSGLRHRRDGYLSNGANDLDRWSGRASIFAQSGPVSVFLTGQYTDDSGIGSQFVLRDRNGAPGLFNPDPDKPYRQTFLTSNLFLDSRSVLIAGQFDVELGDIATLSYTPGYVRSRQDLGVQFNGVLPVVFDLGVDQHTHELRLSGDTRIGNFIA
jgi:iron complex outermembrane receptor protein